MKKIIGGSIAIILGVFCLSAFFSSFLTLLAGIIPLMCILSGCLAIYLKQDSEPSEVEAIEIKTDSVENITDKPAQSTPGLLGNTGTRVFHSLDCKFSKSKKCTDIFDTREEAIQKKYKPCGICKP